MLQFGWVLSNTTYMLSSYSIIAIQLLRLEGTAIHFKIRKFLFTLIFVQIRLWYVVELRSVEQLNVINYHVNSDVEFKSLKHNTLILRKTRSENVNVLYVHMSFLWCGCVLLSRTRKKIVWKWCDTKLQITWEYHNRLK